MSLKNIYFILQLKQQQSKEVQDEKSSKDYM